MKKCLGVASGKIFELHSKLLLARQERNAARKELQEPKDKEAEDELETLQEVMKEGVLAQATIRGLSRRVEDMEDLYSVIYEFSESETEEVEATANGADPKRRAWA
jgi:hypothetical protein